MNSRERVLAAVDHQETDRIAVDFGGHRSSGIMAIAYSKLKKKLGVATGDIYVYDVIQQLAIVEKPALDIFQIDTIEMGRGFLLKESDWKDWELPDGAPCKVPYYANIEKRGEDNVILTENGVELGIQKKGCLFFEQTYFPMTQRDVEEGNFDNLESMLSENMWCGVPHPGAHIPLDEAGLGEMAESARALRKSTDRAILGLFGGNLFEVPQYLCRNDNFFLYMMMYPDRIHQLVEKLYEMYMKNLEKWLKAVVPYIDIIVFGDDYGGQNGPLISPEMYREFFKPYHKSLWKRTKELADVKINLHCCGGVEPLLDDLIDAGLDAINPVQINSHDMNLPLLKEKYAGRLCFWGGGCDTQKILSFATPSEVKRHVKEQIEVFGRKGGFVFQQVHNILANVPAENIVAMFEAVNE
ncbi:methyltransferase [Candidatus Sumerlaeota bacterium]|nr:methyltransferase [Candidatus Sumerlaeota bacterium]